MGWGAMARLGTRLAVMMYVRFPRSLRNVEDLLFERGIDMCHETVRLRWNRFGSLSGEYDHLRDRIAEVNEKLQSWHRSEKCGRRLAQIPGLGPIGRHAAETAGATGLLLGTTFCRPDRVHTKGPLDPRNGAARDHHPCRQRGFAKSACPGDLTAATVQGRSRARSLCTGSLAP